MNTLQHLASLPVIERLGWTLLHSIWQALAVTVCLAVILPAVRRRGARLSYVVCCGALLFTVLLPATTFWILPASAPTRTMSKLDAIDSTATVAKEAPPSGSDDRPLTPEFASSDEHARRGIERPLAPPIAAEVAPSSTAAGLSFRDSAASLGRDLKARLTAWLPWAVFVWTAGVLALSLWNMAGWFSVQRLRSRGTSRVSAKIEQAAARISRLLGLTCTVRILHSTAVQTPIVIGAIKPIILLPISLAIELPPDQLEALVAHELAHILRHDYLVNLLQSVIETLLFYHPAVWWISAQVRSERENCCDDIAVRVAANREAYVQALAAAAGARVQKIVPAATSGQLLPRLRRIMGIADSPSARLSRCLTGAVTLLLCGAAIGFVVVNSRLATAQVKTSEAKTRPTPVPKAAETVMVQPSASKTPDAASRSPVTATRTMRIHVTDGGGEPLPGSRIRMNVYVDEETLERRDSTCDAKGNVTLSIPKTLDTLQLQAAKSGYCRKSYTFSKAFDKSPLPDEHTFRLIKGTTMGGVVKNENGQPIAGARVEYRADTNILSGGLFDEAMSTNAEGRFKFDDVQPGRKLHIRVTHPDYISDSAKAELQKEQNVTTEELRANTATIVMRTGIHVAGKVTDPAGKPVKRAIVIGGDTVSFFTGDFLTGDEIPGNVVRVNADGTYQLPAFAVGPLTLTVIAEGWMPESRTIRVTAKSEKVNVQMRPGKKLQLRFVEPSGAAVPEVNVHPGEWRRRDMFSFLSSPRVTGIDIRFPHKANKQGIFTWDWAPEDAVAYEFGKDGYAYNRGTFTADGREQIVTFSPILRILGNVRDAKTGLPIKDFVAIPLMYSSPLAPILERGRAQQQKAGKLDIEGREPYAEYTVQIESPGYRTFLVPKLFRAGDPSPHLDIQLEPADPYVGRVLDPAGHPVHDARVYVASHIQRLLSTFNAANLEIGMFSKHNYRVHTDRNGSFEIAAQRERYAIVACAPEGFAQVERDLMQIPGEIRLEPWAKITGRVRQSGKPVATCSVSISPIRIWDEDPRLLYSVQTETKNDGSFVVDRVPPVKSRIYSFPNPKSSQSIPLDLAPGQTANVTLGGPGIDVTGQLVVEGGPIGFDYHVSNVLLVANRPGIEPPADLAGKQFDVKQGWNNWTRSPEWGAYLNTLTHWSLRTDADGRFLISGVEPGDYHFSAFIPGSGGSGWIHPLASRAIEVSVKPGQRQLDLGKISMPSLKKPAIGELAYDFEIIAPDGGQTRLSALRGKYVLLAFRWIGDASWLRALDEVERLRKQLPSNRIALVGANLNADTIRNREFLNSRPLPWYQAFLGDWSSTDVPRQYGITNEPTYILVDPTGRIAAWEDSLEKIGIMLRSSSEN